MPDKLNNEDLDGVAGGDTVEQRYAYYTVVHGDTIFGVHYFKTTVEAIMDHNLIITDRNILRHGWILKVPDNR